MKKPLLVSVLFGSATLFLGAAALLTVNWVTPSKTICQENGGTISKYGTCKASWKKAKEICRKHDARLPTLDELKKVVSVCKTKQGKKGSKDLYVKCYKDNGFTGSSAYWSSTLDEKFPKNAYGMNFYSAAAASGSITVEVDVNCVKLDAK